jgi:2-(1,2-epoxy-1,2-dihydrophenyl)acetyl-CoA isomerase
MTLARLEIEDRPAGRLARLTLDRPGRANSLDAALVADLHAALDRAEAARPGALMLAGAGRHFSTGGDVAGFAQAVREGRAQAYSQAVVGGLQSFVLRLLRLPFPVLARVQGALTGGSAGLLFAADAAVMDASAFLQPWYVAVGFAPDGGWTALLPERIGAARALEIQLRNRRVGAAEAQSLGLVSDIAQGEAALDAAADALADEVLPQVPGAVAATRRLIRDEARIAAVETRLEAERAAFLERIETEETARGMAAFLQGG